LRKKERKMKKIKTLVKPFKPNFLEKGMSLKYAVKVVGSPKVYSRKIKHKVNHYGAYFK
jgi:hypothetical protein